MDNAYELLKVNHRAWPQQILNIVEERWLHHTAYWPYDENHKAGDEVIHSKFHEAGAQL